MVGAGRRGTHQSFATIDARAARLDDEPLLSRLLCLASLVLAGCATDVDREGDPDAGTAWQPVTCPVDPDAYTPYLLGGGAPAPVGAAWREGFETYAPPETVECANDKDHRDHLEVTAGCLDSATVSVYRRGVVRTTEGGAFRAVALGGDPLVPDRWTDQHVGYRFHVHAATGTANLPGFKVFARYRSEDDLYVASWRLDGAVLIQRKLCGSYTTLAVRRDLGPPAPDAWHRIRLDAVGDRLDLWLDGARVLTATSATFAWGTAGIRVDSVDGAYLDDWIIE